MGVFPFTRAILLTIACMCQPNSLMILRGRSGNPRSEICKWASGVGGTQSRSCAMEMTQYSMAYLVQMGGIFVSVRIHV